MKNPSHRRSADLEIVACRWVTRRDRGLSAEESAEFETWLSDPRHAQTFAACQAAWASIPLAKSRATDARIEAMMQPRWRRRLAPIRWFSVAAAAAAAAVLLIRPVPPRAENQAPLVREVTAPLNREARIALPDGSVAVLHRGAHISFGEFATARRVRLLNGEAHFTVAKTSGKPFFVHVGTVTIRDIGTAFDVRMEPGEVSVIVTDGSIELRSDLTPADGARLTANVLTIGQQAVIDTRTATTPAISTPPPEALEKLMGWKRRRLSFDRTPLSEAIAELNRYNVRQLSVGDDSLSAVLLAGGVQADDLDAFVGLLQDSFGIGTEIRDNKIVLRKGR